MAIFICCVFIMACSFLAITKGSELNVLNGIDAGISAADLTKVTDYVNQLNLTNLEKTWIESKDIDIFHIQNQIKSGLDIDLLVVNCDLCERSVSAWNSLRKDSEVLCYQPIAKTIQTCYAVVSSAASVAEIVTNATWDHMVYLFDQHTQPHSVSIVEHLADNGHFVYEGILVTPEYDQVAALKSFKDNPDYKQFLLSLDDSTIKEFIKNANEMFMLSPEVQWLIDLTYDPYGFRAMETIVKEVEDCNNVVFILRNWCQDSNKETTICTESAVELYKCQLQSPYYKKLGSKLPGEEIEFYVKVPLFKTKFDGFHGRTFIGTMIHYPPFSIKHTLKNGTEYWTGMCADMLEIMSKVMDFKYNLVEVKDKKFGLRLENGEWNGLVGEVQRKEVDFAITPLTITKAREEVIDYTIAYWEEPSCVIIKAPKVESKLLSSLAPFHWQLWLCCLGGICLTAILLVLFTYWGRQLEPADQRYDLRYDQLRWYTFRSFFQQGDQYSPETHPSRCVAGYWWLVAVILYATYTGNLISFLAIIKLKMPFTTLQQMADQSEFYYGTQDGIVQMMLFSEATSGVYKDIWDGMKANPRSVVSGNVEGFARVQDEKYGFIGEKTNFVSELDGNCDFMFVQEEFYKTGYGYGMQQGWPYVKYFNEAILKLVEAGIVERIRRKYWPKTDCGTQLVQIRDETAISLTDLEGLLYFLCIGMGIGVVVFLFEMIVKKICIGCKTATPSDDTEAEQIPDIGLRSLYNTEYSHKK